MRALVLSTLLAGLALLLWPQTAQSQPNWEPVVGTTDQLLALGKAGPDLLALTANGYYASQDDGQSWLLRQNLRFRDDFAVGATWARDHVLLALVPGTGLNQVGYPFLKFELWHSENGANLAPTDFGFTPNGAMGTTYQFVKLYAADDTTICVQMLRGQTSFPSNYYLAISRNSGQNWDTYLNFPGYHASTLFANTGTALWGLAADSVYRYALPNANLLATQGVPGVPEGLIGGFWATDDTLTVVSGLGQWRRSGDNGLNWIAGQLPFGAIESFWQEKSIFYVRNAAGLYRSADFLSPVWETIYEEGVSTNFTANRILRGGELFFTQNGANCLALSRRQPGQTGHWDTLQPVGPDVANTGPLLLRNDTPYVQLNCHYALGCGGVLRPASLGPPQPASFAFHGQLFQQAPDSSIRRSVDGETWVTVLANAGFSGRFTACGSRLLLYGDAAVQYSNDNGDNWTAGNWGGTELWCDGPDTLLRRLVAPSPTYERSFNGGADWALLPLQPGAAAIWSYGGRLVTASGDDLWTSADWAESWEHQVTDGAGLLFKTWHQDSIFIADFQVFSYPVCVVTSFVTTDGGASWQRWSNPPFRSAITCGNSLPFSMAARDYRAHDGWLYARSDLSGLWRTRLNELGTPASPAGTVFRDTLCTGETYAFWGDSLHASGLYQKWVVTPNGCDSIARLRLTVLPQLVQEQTRTICAGDTAHFYGLWYTATGVYEQLAPGPNGCDQLVRLDLTVLPFDTLHWEEAICPGEGFEFAGQLLSVAGDYIYTYPDDCQSIVLHLTVNTDTVVARDTSLIVGSVFLGQSITGDTLLHQTLTAVNGCDSTVVWTVMATSSGLVDLASPGVWQVTPNPASDWLQVSFSDQLDGPLQLRLLSATGSVCRSWQWPRPPGAPMLRLSLDGLSTGAYFLELSTPAGRNTRRLMLLRDGTEHF